MFVLVSLKIELDAIRYLETQHNWIGNYENWQGQSYPAVSGMPGTR
jgi:hypothetical protein